MISIIGKQFALHMCENFSYHIIILSDLHKKTGSAGNLVGKVNYRKSEAACLLQAGKSEVSLKTSFIRESRDLVTNCISP
jgi:hypothetical protein